MKHIYIFYYFVVKFWILFVHVNLHCKLTRNCVHDYGFLLWTSCWGKFLCKCQQFHNNSCHFSFLLLFSHIFYHFHKKFFNLPFLIILLVIVVIFTTNHHKSTTNFSATLLCCCLLNPVLNMISNKSTYVFLSIIIIHFTTICNLINTTILSQWSFFNYFSFTTSQKRSQKKRE